MASSKGNTGSAKRQATARSKPAKSARQPLAWRTFFLGCAAGALVCVAWYEGWFVTRDQAARSSHTASEEGIAGAESEVRLLYRAAGEGGGGSNPEQAAQVGAEHRGAGKCTSQQ